MKLIEVIHYYLGVKVWVDHIQKIGHLFNIGKDEVIKVAFADSGWGIYSLNENQVHLLLRPLSSMTEEEYKEIRDKLSIDVVGAIQEPFRWVDKPKHVLVLENRLQTNTLRFNDGILLMKRGYDLFKLIETGEAIDITKINKDGLFKR